MKWLIGTLALVAFACVMFRPLLLASDRVPAQAEYVAPAQLAEARSRALVLHEVIRGTLQVVHRDFFNDEESHAIPSASFEDVFHGVQERFGIKLKWLVVNADVVNVDHVAADEFEKRAVAQLAEDKPYEETATADEYRFAAPIRLESQCLKCHVKMRTSNEPRKSALVITMPLHQTP